jgi:hypothetical protein
MKSAIYILLGFLFISCNLKQSKNDNYPKDAKVSDSNGKPKDSLSFYFPAIIKKDTTFIKTGFDSLTNNWYSKTLYAAQEPILYNYYLGHDIYRFLWLRAFSRPVVISINKDGAKIWLSIKALNKQIDIADILPQITFLLPASGYSGKPKVKMSIEQNTKADRKANLILNNTIALSERDWVEFENLLKNCSFWTMAPIDSRLGIDGSEWIIEGHLKNKYWVVNRWSPENVFREAGLFLIKKSGLEEKIY